MPRKCRSGTVLTAALLASVSGEFVLLDPEAFRGHFVEGSPCPVPPCGRVNASSFDWARANLPFFESDAARRVLLLSRQDTKVGLDLVATCTASYHLSMLPRSVNPQPLRYCAPLRPP